MEQHRRQSAQSSCAEPVMYEGPLFQPCYRPICADSWQLELIPALIAPGYWSPSALMTDVAALKSGGATWMSMTMMEIESQEIGIRLAHGHVVIFGLGMGWAAAATAALDAVDRVSVVEADTSVLALHRELGLFQQLPPAAAAKISVLHGDARTYVPERPVDLLMADIWLPLVGGDRVSEVAAMQANVQARAIYFWGQELEIARRAVAAGRELEDAGIAATIAEFDLPLVGLETPGYAARVRCVAERWMRNRWLEPSHESGARPTCGSPCDPGCPRLD